MSKRSKNGKKRLRKFVNDLKFVLDKHKASIFANPGHSIQIQFEDMNVLCYADDLCSNKVSIRIGEEVLESL